MKRIKLFCIPCAGGSATSYLKWERFLQYKIELCPIELKSRGVRIKEDQYNDIDEAVTDIMNVIKDDIVDEDYALFGHSMGALIVYELYYKLLENNIPLPKNIFIFGKEPPSIPYTGKIFHEMEEEKFKDSIIELGGVPSEVSDNKEVFDFFLPIIRNDFKITEEYRFKEKNELMHCNLTVINGTEDKISSKNLDEYESYTTGEFKLYKIKGGHFQLFEKPMDTIKIINNILDYK